MKDKRRFGIERNIYFIGLTSFFTDISTKMVYSIMPMFLLSLGASKTTISLIEGIAESTAALLKVFSGIWSDRLKKSKPFMLIGYGLSSLIIPLYSLVIFPFQVLILRFIERVGKGIRAAPRDSLISASSPEGKVGKSFGIHKAMDNSGAIIGPLAAFSLLYFFQLKFEFIFLIAAIPAFIGVFIIITFIKEVRSTEQRSKLVLSFSALPRNYYFFLLIVFLFTLGNSTDALLLVKATETGIDPFFIPLLYLTSNVVSVALAVPLGKLSDKIGRGKLIVAGYLVYSGTYLLFGMFDRIEVLVFLFIPYGIYSGLTDGSHKALVTDLVGKNLKGTGFGIFHALIGITLLPASLIAGTLYDNFGNGAPFYFGSMMSFLAAILMVVFVVRGRKGGHLELTG